MATGVAVSTSSLTTSSGRAQQCMIARMPEVTWKCASCGFEIADGDGWVHARMSEVNDQEEAVREWKAKHQPEGKSAVSVAQLLDYPEQVNWHALHEVCDPTGGEPYAIGVEDLRTSWDLIKWTVQLLEKSWLAATDWREVLRAKHREAQPE
jgi:hypothetical protein